MNFNLLEQLGSSGDINPNDLKLLTGYLTQIQSGKIPRVSLEEKNKLTSLISKYGPKQEINKNMSEKDIKDMSEQERQAFREDAKRRLREKRNSMLNSRQSKFVIEKNMNKSKTNNASNNASNNAPRNPVNNPGPVMPNINGLQNMDLSKLTNMLNEITNNSAINENSNDEKLEDFLE